MTPTEPDLSAALTRDALEAVAPPGLADQVAAAERELAEAGISAPVWAGALGKAVPGVCWF